MVEDYDSQHGNQLDSKHHIEDLSEDEEQSQPRAPEGIICSALASIAPSIPLPLSRRSSRYLPG
jgi:hypothetical protein